MTDRLKSGYFSSKKLFIADMMRIFTNCRTYNAPETEYYKCANTVERFFLSKVKELRKTNWAPMSHHLSTPELIFKKWNFSFAIKTNPASNHAERMVLFLILCTNLNQRLPAARRENCQIDRRSCRFFSETRFLWKSTISFPGSPFFLFQRTWNDMKGEGRRG